MEFYIDDNQANDEFEEDCGIYDELDLDDADLLFNLNLEDQDDDISDIGTEDRNSPISVSVPVIEKVSSHLT